MRIGLSAAGSNAGQLVRQAEQAEADGFTSLWYASPVQGDPLAAMVAAGRATAAIELGTAVLQTYACHPVLQAARAVAAAAAIGGGGRFSLGLGPSHREIVEGQLGLAYDRPGRHTEEYVQIVTGLLSGRQVRFAGEEYQVSAGPLALAGDMTMPVLLAALGPRLLRVAGTHAAGTVTWLANAAAVERHVGPAIRAAAQRAGRPAPRIVAGLPVAVHDDAAAVREAAASRYARYASRVNYQRILGHGGAAGPGDVVLAGAEASVTAQVRALFDAGATDVWLEPFGVGPDPAASRSRTADLLRELARA